MTRPTELERRLRQDPDPASRRSVDAALRHLFRAGLATRQPDDLVRVTLAAVLAAASREKRR